MNYWFMLSGSLFYLVPIRDLAYYYLACSFLFILNVFLLFSISSASMSLNSFNLVIVILAKPILEHVLELVSAVSIIRRSSLKSETNIFHLGLIAQTKSITCQD